MPKIGVNLSDVQAYEAPPHGNHEAEITAITLRPAQEEGKFDQQMVKYTIIEDGPSLGQTATEWLSFSPKAAFRMKKWYDKFGYGELDDLDFDDDTDELVEPDLIGTRVIIKSYEELDKRNNEMRDRIALVEVLDDDVAPPKKASKKEAVAVDADEDDDEDEDEKPSPRARREPAKAAVAGKRRSLR